MNRLELSVLTVVLAFAASACNPEPQSTSESAPPINVVMVVVDTLRADHMSVYGYERPTTPFLEELSSKLVVFERARSQAGCTFPSANSYLTSHYPFDFYHLNRGNMGIPDEMTTMAEFLSANGYTTIAVSASPIVRKTPTEFNPDGGFDAGFKVFDENCAWKDASCVNRRALKHLSGVREPFFLYLHYMDPHGPYSPPPDHGRRFAGSYEGGHEFVAEGVTNPISEMLYDDGPRVDISHHDIQHLVDLYDDEILYFDGQFEGLISILRNDELFDQSLFIVASDHGEEFMEHRHIGHCRGAWDTLTRTPLLLHVPGMKNGQRMSSPVQNIDILPTVLDYAGVDPEDTGLEGVSLREMIEGGPAARDYAYADQGKYRTVDDGRFQLVFDGYDKTAELFSVETDPRAQHDLLATEPETVHRLTLELNRWLKDTGQWNRFDGALTSAKEQEDRLRALGYLE